MLIPMTLMALSVVQQDTDTTVSVPANARLELTNQAGEVVVETWNRSAIRVQAEHGSRDRIEIETRGSVVTIRARRRFGIPAIVDYRLTVPADMELKLDGIHLELEATGVRAVQAQTVEGDLRVADVGSVNLGSVEGDISVANVRGATRVHAVDGDVVLRDIVGSVAVETVDGDVTLDGIESTEVDVSTVDGEVLYRGAIMSGGRYRMSSHDGDVVLVVDPSINATISVATFDGEFEAEPAFRVQVRDARPGRRFSFVLGDGSAQVELESFDGTIRLVRP